ncbi:hypothetical protein [Halomonas sp.]|uniref:hypothetical protein n=1 Tax=Halomonas sp. TaxID=1486246 RepID=UPI00356A2847
MNPEIELDIQRGKDFSLSDYPHQPEKYHITTHFRQRMKDPERFLSGEVIARTFTCGALRVNEDGCAAFNWTRGDGVEYWLLAGFHEAGYRIAITAWPYLRDRQKALDSYRWTKAEIDTIEAFNQKKLRYGPLEHQYPDYIKWSQQNPHGGLVA